MHSDLRNYILNSKMIIILVNSNNINLDNLFTNTI